MKSKINYKSWIDGMTGEEVFGNLLAQSGILSTQVDRLAIFENKIVLFEIKTLSLFKAGNNFPYDGHGIHPKQLELKLKVANQLNADAVMVVFCKTTGLIYYQNCINLLKCKNYYVCKKHGQYIYPVDEFEVATYDEFRKRIFRTR